METPQCILDSIKKENKKSRAWLQKVQEHKVKERTGEYLQRTETNIQEKAEYPKIQMHQWEIQEIWKEPEETIQNITWHFGKNKEVILLESTDDFTMAKKMANFLMNKIYKINDALES